MRRKLYNKAINEYSNNRGCGYYFGLGFGYALLLSGPIGWIILFIIYQFNKD